MSQRKGEQAHPLAEKDAPRGRSHRHSSRVRPGERLGAGKAAPVSRQSPSNTTGMCREPGPQQGLRRSRGADSKHGELCAGKQGRGSRAPTLSRPHPSLTPAGSGRARHSGSVRGSPLPLLAQTGAAWGIPGRGSGVPAAASVDAQRSSGLPGDSGAGGRDLPWCRDTFPVISRAGTPCLRSVPDPPPRPGRKALHLCTQGSAAQPPPGGFPAALLQPPCPSTS